MPTTTRDSAEKSQEHIPQIEPADAHLEPSPSIPSGASTPEKAESILLADRPTPYIASGRPITDSIVNFFRLKGKHRDSEVLDDIATQPSVYDGPLAHHYQPRADWEVCRLS